MKLKGRIKLQKTPGRQDPWVKKQLEHDYFLSLEIGEIDGVSITTCESAFKVLKDYFPAITVGDDGRLNDLFQHVSLPPSAVDVLHLTLGNFGDFRVDRNVANDIDTVAVANAEDINGTDVELELPENAFELVTTSEFSNKLQFEAGKITKASTVGFNRDTIINIRPTDEGQTKISQFSKQVFGSDFVLWNAQGQPVPFHVTVAQTNQLKDFLAKKFPIPDEVDTAKSATILSA